MPPMAKLNVVGDVLQVRFSGAEKVLGLVRDHSFPLSSVSSVRVERSGLAAAQGLRAPGLGLPGLRKIGTWRGHGRTLVSASHDQPAVVVDLVGQRFDRLVIGSDGAVALAARLRARA